MTATVDTYEHQALARLIDHAAEAAHAPDDCSLCADLDIRRHLRGLAERIRSAADKQAEQPKSEPPKRVNNTPHEHGPKPTDPPAKGGQK